jgi:hypothetical protein
MAGKDRRDGVPEGCCEGLLGFIADEGAAEANRA